MRKGNRLLALFLGATITACGGSTLDEVPEELRGAWITDAEAYAERGFTLEARTLTLLRGEASSVTRPLDRIEAEVEDGVTRYHLHHRSAEGTMDVLSIRFEEQPGRNIVWIDNLPRVAWYRAAPATGGAGAGR